MVSDSHYADMAEQSAGRCCVGDRERHVTNESTA